MAKEREILVKDVLELMNDNADVYLTLTFYGVHCNERLSSVKDIKEKSNAECLRSVVTEIGETYIDNNAAGFIHINAEMIH
jgi:hypothetical protein